MNLFYAANRETLDAARIHTACMPTAQEGYSLREQEKYIHKYTSWRGGKQGGMGEEGEGGRREEGGRGGGGS